MKQQELDRLYEDELLDVEAELRSDRMSVEEYLKVRERIKAATRCPTCGRCRLRYT